MDMELTPEVPVGTAGLAPLGLVRDHIFITDGSDQRTICLSPSMPPGMHRTSTWRVDEYELHKELYRGKTSLLYQATCKKSGLIIALKLYRKRKLSTLNRYQVEREIRIHIALDHENIIKLYGAFEDEKNVYMVQEFANGGDLFENLKKSGGQLKEAPAVTDVLVPFLAALAYLHSLGVIHRDIKPENILLSGSRVLKVADFGLSVNVRQERPVTRAGTLDYMAPEVLVCPDKRRPEENKDKVSLAYTSQVDSWAVGILAYELMVGYPPFEQESRAATYEHIMYKEPKFPSWMSDDARRFIALALCKDAVNRPTIADLSRHPLVSSPRPSATVADSAAGSISLHKLISKHSASQVPPLLNIHSISNPNSASQQPSYVQTTTTMTSTGNVGQTSTTISTTITSARSPKHHHQQQQQQQPQHGVQHSHSIKHSASHPSIDVSGRGMDSSVSEPLSRCGDPADATSFGQTSPLSPSGGRTGRDHILPVANAPQIARSHHDPPSPSARNSVLHHHAADGGEHNDVGVHSNHVVSGHTSPASPLSGSGNTTARMLAGGTRGGDGGESARANNGGTNGGIGRPSSLFSSSKVALPPLLQVSPGQGDRIGGDRDEPLSPQQSAGSAFFRPATGVLSDDAATLMHSNSYSHTNGHGPLQNAVHGNSNRSQSQVYLPNDGGEGDADGSHGEDASSKQSQSRYARLFGKLWGSNAAGGGGKESNDSADTPLSVQLSGGSSAGAVGGSGRSITSQRSAVLRNSKVGGSLTPAMPKLSNSGIIPVGGSDDLRLTARELSTGSKTSPLAARGGGGGGDELFVATGPHKSYSGVSGGGGLASIGGGTRGGVHHHHHIGNHHHVAGGGHSHHRAASNSRTFMGALDDSLSTVGRINSELLPRHAVGLASGRSFSSQSTSAMLARKLAQQGVIAARGGQDCDGQE